MISDDELAEIEARAGAATPGPWYAHATDDEVFSNARYVSVQPGEFRHDNKRGMDSQSDERADSEKVIAITLLQSPRLAECNECDENTLFIAHARSDIPRLIAEIRRLKAGVSDSQE